MFIVVKFDENLNVQGSRPQVTSIVHCTALLCKLSNQNSVIFSPRPKQGTLFQIRSVPWPVWTLPKIISDADPYNFSDGQGEPSHELFSRNRL